MLMNFKSFNFCAKIFVFFVVVSNNLFSAQQSSPDSSLLSFILDDQFCTFSDNFFFHNKIFSCYSWSELNDDSHLAASRVKIEELRKIWVSCDLEKTFEAIEKNRTEINELKVSLDQAQIQLILLNSQSSDYLVKKTNFISQQLSYFKKRFELFLKIIVLQANKMVTCMNDLEKKLEDKEREIKDCYQTLLTGELKKEQIDDFVEKNKEKVGYELELERLSHVLAFLLFDGMKVVGQASTNVANSYKECNEKIEHLKMQLGTLDTASFDEEVEKNEEIKIIEALCKELYGHVVTVQIFACFGVYNDSHFDQIEKNNYLKEFTNRLSPMLFTKINSKINSPFIAGVVSAVVKMDLSCSFQCAKNIKVEKYVTLSGQNLDLEKILATLPQDECLSSLIQRFGGLRIIQQYPWECLAHFILSAFNNIKRIQQMSERLSYEYGRGHQLDNKTFYRFPHPSAVARATEKELRQLGLGYRAPYLLATARLVDSGKINLGELKSLAYEEIKENLLQCPGVGEKVVECVLLFAYSQWQAFPVDVWIERLIRQNYFPRRRKISLKRLQGWAKGYFGPYAGYAQQYFYCGRRHYFPSIKN